jgi:hypothetical protein
MIVRLIPHVAPAARDAAGRKDSLDLGVPGQARRPNQMCRFTFRNVCGQLPSSRFSAARTGRAQFGATLARFGTSKDPIQLSRLE